MKPRNINNSLPLQPLVPDQENKNKKNEEKSVNPVKITMGSGLNYIEQESLGGKYLTHDLSIKIADISEEIIQKIMAKHYNHLVKFAGYSAVNHYNQHLLCFLKSAS